jgi:hypothetical protein
MLILHFDRYSTDARVNTLPHGYPQQRPHQLRDLCCGISPMGERTKRKSRLSLALPSSSPLAATLAAVGRAYFCSLV